MNKTLIALLTAASFLTIGAAQAADKPADAKPAAEAAKPADAKPAAEKKAKKAKKSAKKAEKKAEGAAK